MPRARLVFPAHAGIVPHVFGPPLDLVGLPRTRGDRPARDFCWIGMIQSSPHTRGSSVNPRVAKWWPGVFPAHAGIVPDYTSELLKEGSLPRTRGDRPETEKMVLQVAQSSPHTRGSSLSPFIEVFGHHVFPAHAGIFRRRCHLRPQRSCLPRTRGDRPAIAPIGGGFCQFSPHTRGSSPRVRTTQGRLLVFLAHAGIDLVVSLWIGDCCFPVFFVGRDSLLVEMAAFQTVS